MVHGSEQHTLQPLEVSVPGGAGLIPPQCLHQTGLLLPREGHLEGEGGMLMFFPLSFSCFFPPVTASSCSLFGSPLPPAGVDTGRCYAGVCLLKGSLLSKAPAWGQMTMMQLGP